MRRYALLVGVDTYADRAIPPLRFAERDAQALGRVLAERYGFEVRCLVGEEARREAILNVLGSGRLSEQAVPMQAGDQFLFFFAGHGELVGSNYVLHPWNAKAGAHSYVDHQDRHQLSAGQQRAVRGVHVHSRCLPQPGASGGAGRTGAR